ncbi:MAG: hypothetical protein JWN52_4454 [Actinomycetia bacterium]|nr:hypothetical protein [Actinomycetes bacterium]
MRLPRSFLRAGGTPSHLGLPSILHERVRRVLSSRHPVQMTPPHQECATCRHVALRIRTAVWGIALSAAMVSSLWLPWARQGNSNYSLDELDGRHDYDIKTWILVALPLVVIAAAEGTKELAAFAAVMTTYTAYMVGTGIDQAVLDAGSGLRPGAVLALSGSIGLTLLFCYLTWRGPWGRLSSIWPRHHGE